MKRHILSMVIALMLVVAVAGQAFALTITLTPSTQTHAHGVSSNWTGSWGTHAPYDVHMCYVFGTSECASWLFGTNLVTKNWSHAYFPCSTTQFTDELYVLENTGADGILRTKATENGGTPC